MAALLACSGGGAVAGCGLPGGGDSSVGAVALLQRGRQAHRAYAQAAAGAPVAHLGAAAAATWSFYQASLVPLLLVTLIFAWLSRPRLDVAVPQGFRAFQRSYLGVWCLAAAADWLQGPYVYALYESYGYSTDAISRLFVAGFMSSMVFGIFVGSLADSCGRKRCALLYCVLYILSCATKHCNHYGVLMVGRITGGIATSLLFSTFECWMISEHCQRNNFGEPLLRYMFSLMFLVQYSTAVVSGLVAQAAADALPLTRWAGGGPLALHYGGSVRPFDCSGLCLLVAIPLICILWEENYGDASQQQTFAQSFAAALRTLRSTWRVSLIGVVVACFEGSMYSFVLNWTPALASEATPPPHGLIFSSFMMACMCGSAMFGLLNPQTPPAKILLVMLAPAAGALGLAALTVGREGALPAVYAAFLAFELCVGLYFPAIGALKSQAVPEAARAGVYNAYRVPLNLAVVLLQLTSLPLRSSFLACSALLVGALLCVAPMHFAAPAAEKA